MTLTTTINRNDYTATSAQTVFAYAFRILADADLDVYVEGVIQTLTTDYTVSGAGDAGGGNVTFTTGVTLDEAVAIIRGVTQTQDTDYTASGPFTANDHETALDRNMMVSQDIDEKLARAVKFIVSSTLSAIAAPEGSSVTDRASKVWAWDSAGTGLELLAATIVDAVSVIAAKGDIVQGNASGAAAKLAIGTAGQVLTVASGLAVWSALADAIWNKGNDIDSATTLILEADATYNDITGIIQIDGIADIVADTMRRVHFDDALQLTHSATLQLPNDANITTIEGDEATFIQIDSTPTWRLVGWAGHVLEHDHTTAAQGGVIGADFASGTKILFKQATAPTGWTIDDTITDKSAVRYTRGATHGADAGSVDLATGVSITQGHSLSIAESAAHTHTQKGAASGSVGTVGSIRIDVANTGDAGATASAGSGTAHGHNIDLRYIDVIVATKD
ncbi:hypothetical protein LCGC14_0997610 [marine sediment metagenome]|uniref:Uncharacterized protein n=1 Tax=marine sediment metagenome TaxID=412755 RepID=A0A0F9N8Q3_9ZZZZ